jgi:hypothetical protein
MLPIKKKNVYPKTDENLQALISFYFAEFNIGLKDSLKVLNENTSLSLNQIEFIIRKLSEAYIPIFRKQLKTPIEFSNLFKYGLNALVNNEINKSGSKNRQLITKEFQDFVKETEVNISFIEKNN